MLYGDRLNEALFERKAEFARFDEKWRDEIQRYDSKLKAVSEQTSKEILSLIDYEKSPGAIPSNELDKYKSVYVPFSEHWRNHEEARQWANAILKDRTTFAADASQLLPGREISLPVAVIQAAWFENNHRGNDYIKDVAIEIISPEELLEEHEGRVNAENVVSLRRFRLEIKTLTKFLERKRGWQERGERTPVAFFDGTILLSISQPQTDLQGLYVDTMVQLVRLSEETKIPLVGFIDQSYAKDLITMLDTSTKTPKSERSRSLYDAQLLHETGEQKLWGDRTTFFYCKRKGLNEFFHDAEGKPLVGFIYLQTTGEGTPSRLDVPSWIYEEGLLDEVVDVVRAECVIGLGYPYAIETADQTAVIKVQDRERFFSAMQEFANKSGLGFRVSRKAISKMRRR